jgi:2,4-diketo-3-deoxy-L-fuconate hydrolase
MPVQVARYLHEGETSWGVVHGRHIAPLPRRYASTAEFVNDGIEDAWNSTSAEARLSLDDVALLPPITDDRQFICQGINYASHVRESGMDPAKIGFNTLFTKAPSCMVSAQATIERPAHVRLLDYEIELGLVVRRPLTSATSIGPDQLHEWLAGVVIVNDVSARDVQLPETYLRSGRTLSRAAR